MKSTFKVHMVLAFVNLLYGASYVVAKIIMPENLGALGMVALRVPAATLLFWLFHFFASNSPTPASGDLLRFFASALFGVVLNQLFFFKGISLTSPILASVIMTSTPIAVLIISYFLIKEKITWLKFGGIITGAFGAILLITSKGTDFSNSTFQGNVFVLINAISYSIYLVIVKPLMAKYDSLTVIKWIFLFGSIMVFPFGVGDLLIAEWTNFDYSVWLSIAYIILGTTFLAYLLNLWALKLVSPSIVGYYIYLQPIFATIMAVLFRGDELTLQHIVFSILIFGGVFMVSYKKTSS